MKTEEFIEKWLVGYESLEQKAEFSIEMESDLEDLSNTSKWISVEDRLPERGVKVIVYFCNIQTTLIGRRMNDSGGNDVWMVFFADGEKANNNIYSEDITHWMPLPNAPEKP